MYNIQRLGTAELEYKSRKEKLKEERRYLRLYRKNRRRKPEHRLMPIYTEDVTARGIKAGLKMEQLFRERRDEDEYS